LTEAFRDIPHVALILLGHEMTLRSCVRRLRLSVSGLSSRRPGWIPG